MISCRLWLLIVAGVLTVCCGLPVDTRPGTDHLIVDRAAPQPRNFDIVEGLVAKFSQLIKLILFGGNRINDNWLMGYDIKSNYLKVHHVERTCMGIILSTEGLTDARTIAAKMMQHAGKYTDSNSLQRVDTRALLREVLPLLTWAKDGADTVLDVGCGPGDVTAELLLPAAPCRATLWGVDLGESLVKHANMNHSSDRLKFTVADFGSETIERYLPTNYYTKVFSFYCLHWIHDQRQVVKNLRQVLRPGGEAVLHLMTRITGMTAFQLLSQMERWAPYVQGIDRLFPFYSVASPSQEMRTLLATEGMEVELCEDRVHHHTYPSLDVLIDSFMAVNPWVGTIPAELLKTYRADLTRIVLEHDLCEVLTDSRARLQYHTLVVVCRKPSNQL